MSDLIRREDFLDLYNVKEEYKDYSVPLPVIIQNIKDMPAVDAVEVPTIQAWLYEIAGNNINTEKERQFSVLCEELISRLDGLRNFARERRKSNE